MPHRIPVRKGVPLLVGIAAGVVAQHSSGDVSGWEELGIVIAGSLIAATIISIISWIGKPAHKVHLVGTRLRLESETDEVDLSSSDVVRVSLVVTNTSDTYLLVALAGVSAWMDGDPLDPVKLADVRHELSPDQRHTLRADIPWNGPSTFSFVDREEVAVSFEIDYGRRVMWRRFRRRLTATIEAKMPWNQSGLLPFSDLNWAFAAGGSPRDRLLWRRAK